MGASFSVDVEDMRNIKKRLSKLEGSELEKELDGARRRASDIVAARAVSEAPVGATRRLAGSIGVGSDNNVSVGNSMTPYAGVVHFGNPRRKSRWNKFVYRAINRTFKDVLEVYTSEVDEIIKRAGL